VGLCGDRGYNSWWGLKAEKSPWHFQAKCQAGQPGWYPSLTATLGLHESAVGQAGEVILSSSVAAGGGRMISMRLFMQAVSSNEAGLVFCMCVAVPVCVYEPGRDPTHESVAAVARGV
jgi:hypothetical protein